jgi:hypothetical protein
VNTYNALLDGSPAVAHIYAGATTLATLGSAVSGRYRVVRGHFPRPLRRAIGLGGIAVAGTIGFNGVATGARSFQTTHGLLPPGMRASSNLNSIYRSTGSSAQVSDEDDSVIDEDDSEIED